MMSFIDFINKYKLKNKGTSNMKFYQKISSVRLDRVDIYLRDGPFSSDLGSVNLYTSKVTHWVVYINEKFLDFYGCAPPQNYVGLI